MFQVQSYLPLSIVNYGVSLILCWLHGERSLPIGLLVTGIVVEANSRAHLTSRNIAEKTTTGLTYGTGEGIVINDILNISYMKFLLLVSNLCLRTEKIH